MRSYRAQLRVEELGSRIMPSTVNLLGYAAQALAAAHTSVQHHHQHSHKPPHADSSGQSLSGSGSGSYTTSMGIPDTGTTTDLGGVATLDGQGTFTVTGEFHSLGYILFGHAGGTLTFTNDQGSFTLQLDGPLQTGFSPLPQSFTYSVLSGTGAYQNLQASGSVSLTLTAATGGFTLQF
jgi:hypothetical protein